MDLDDEGREIDYDEEVFTKSEGVMNMYTVYFEPSETGGESFTYFDEALDYVLKHRFKSIIMRDGEVVALWSEAEGLTTSFVNGSFSYGN